MEGHKYSRNKIIEVVLNGIWYVSLLWVIVMTYEDKAPKWIIAVLWPIIFLLQLFYGMYVLVKGKDKLDKFFLMNWLVAPGIIILAFGILFAISNMK